MERAVRTGRIDWGRSPSAIAYVEVLRKDNSSSLLMIQPAHPQYRMRELPADFKYVDHRQCLLTIPQEILRANTCSDKHETITYDVVHLSDRPSTSGRRTRHLEVQTTYPFFGLGSGWCYLCFPPRDYVPEISSRNGLLWVWGKDLLAIGCCAPECAVAFSFDYDPVQYRGLVGPGPFNLWATGNLQFLFDQSFLHVAICQTVQEYRALYGTHH